VRLGITKHDSQNTKYQGGGKEMRKLIVLSLAGLLILAFGATAYAQAPKLEFRASGFIDAQTFLGENVPQYNSGPQVNAATAGLPPAGGADLYRVINPNYWTSKFTGANTGFGAQGWNRDQFNWEARAHLKFDAVMGPNLSGTIYFEIDTFRFGNNYSSAGMAPWSLFNTGTGREANNFGGWTTDRTSVEVKNIYIDVGLPYFGLPVPMTVRVGAQTLGVRPAMLMVSDGTGVTAGINLDPVMIMPMWAGAVYGTDYTANSTNVYGLHANAKLGTFTVGGYGLYWNMDTYPFFVLSYNGGLPTSALTFSTLQGTNKAKVGWFGVYADGKAGPVNVNFDWVFDYGRVDPTPNALPTTTPVTYQGWAGRLKVDFPWEKLNFGAVGMYATGSDSRRTDPMGMPGNLTSNGTMSRRVSGYVVPPGSEQAPANNESLVIYSMEAGATGGYGIADMSNYGAMNRGGFGGTWFAKLYGSVKITPWLKITLQELYVGDTTIHGTTFGTAVRPGTTILKHYDSIGWETDLLADIQIYQNLRLWLGYGYLFAGDALKINDGGINRLPMNPWAFRTRLMYTF
jgi:hypothetical protein